ncbi:MAG TPA: glycoside hydrolase family 16 protein [Candidatus Saccharimonadales bacterium]|nr:glycoside hydrolase family 16 protein [Candidatus Saccharimonadales bacterium]
MLLKRRPIYSLKRRRRLSVEWRQVFYVGMAMASLGILAVYDAIAHAPGSPKKQSGQYSQRQRASVAAAATAKSKPKQAAAPAAQSTIVAGGFATAAAWEQDFSKMPDGPVDANYWTPDTNPDVPTFNQEAQAYQPGNSAVQGGKLVITARKGQTTYPGDSRSYAYSSGKIMTFNHNTGASLPKGLTFEYGRIEASIKMPPGSGTWPAFWLLSANQPNTGRLNPTDADWDQPRFYMHDGEIDIVEHYGSNNTTDATFYTFDKTSESEVTVPDAEQKFHTYSVDITPTAVTWKIDGQTVKTAPKPANATANNWPVGGGNKWFAMLNLAMGGTGGGAIDDSKGPWRMEVANVRYFAYAGGQ